jgi:hypothetical protein
VQLRAAQTMTIEPYTPVGSSRTGTSYSFGRIQLIPVAGCLRPLAAAAASLSAGPPRRARAKK